MAVRDVVQGDPLGEVPHQPLRALRRILRRPARVVRHNQKAGVVPVARSAVTAVGHRRHPDRCRAPRVSSGACRTSGNSRVGALHHASRGRSTPGARRVPSAARESARRRPRCPDQDQRRCNHRDIAPTALLLDDAEAGGADLSTHPDATPTPPLPAARDPGQHPPHSSHGTRASHTTPSATRTRRRALTNFQPRPWHERQVEVDTGTPMTRSKRESSRSGPCERPCEMRAAWALVSLDSRSGN